MHSELCIEIGKGVEGMGIVEAALILAVAAFHLAVVTGRIRADELVPDAEVSSSLFKESNPFTV